MAETKKVNEDLIRERQKCTFDIQELTHLFDGSPEKTKDRKEFDQMILSLDNIKDPIPEEYLSHKEKYENVIRKATIVTSAARKYLIEKGGGLEQYGPTNTYRIITGVIKDVSPLLLHAGMFIPTLMGQASEEQQNEWLLKAMNMEILGTYAQTELGHGTFLRGLETTATYDPSTEEFILHSPSLTSYKWWPGGLGSTVNHCIVVAQLYIKNKCYGVHPFFVRIRDLDTHMPLPGIKVGEIGPKMGFSTANNGFLGFEHFRVPRFNMLNKNAQVLKDGTYVKSKNEKAAYGTMVFVRVMIVSDVAYYLAAAATIATRYSAVRHQSLIRPDQPEPAIIEYVTQQQKIFLAIASSHAFRTIGVWLWDTYNKVNAKIRSGNTDELPELHALACCLKAVCSKDAAAGVEQCRLACGGHGYMLSSNLPILYGVTTATNTYEGENTVLLLQTARFLIKAWQQANENKVMTPTVAYLVDNKNNNSSKWENTPEGIVRGFQAVAAGKIKTANDTLQKHLKSGMVYEDAWNMASIQLTYAAEAHCRAVLCQVYWNVTKEKLNQVSANLGKVLSQLAELYVIYWALEKTGDLLTYSNVSKTDFDILRQRYEQSLALIRPNAVGIVDAFDIPDQTLNSTLGSYDGRVYERLMEEAMKSPLNKEQVNQSFHKYLKPMMQGKL